MIETSKKKIQNPRRRGESLFIQQFCEAGWRVRYVTISIPMLALISFELVHHLQNF